MFLTPSFRRLWTGNLAGNLADGIAFVVVPLLAATLTTNPLWIAGLSSAYSLTRLLVALPIGVLVDSAERRLLLWAGNIARGTALLLLAVTVCTRHGSIGVLYVAYCLVGVLENLADGAASAVIPDLVDDNALDAANSSISTTQLVADEFAGPPLGGLLFGIAAALSLAATGALYLVAGVLFRLLPRTPHPQQDIRAAEPARNPWQQAVVGLRWAINHPTMRFLLGIAALTNFAYMAPFSILVVYALHTLHLSSTGYGVLLSFSSLGGLVGAAIAAPVRRRAGTRTTLAASLLLGSVTMAGLGITTNKIAAGVLLVLYILHATVFGITSTSLRQRLVPAELRGRVYAASRVMSLAGLTLGGLAGGALAHAVSLTSVFLLSGAVFLTTAVWTLRQQPEPSPA